MTTIIKISKKDKDVLIRKYINELNKISLLKPDERKEKLKECINEAQDIILKNIRENGGDSKINTIIGIEGNE